MRRQICINHVRIRDVYAMYIFFYFVHIHRFTVHISHFTFTYLYIYIYIYHLFILYLKIIYVPVRLSIPDNLCILHPAFSPFYLHRHAYLRVLRSALWMGSSHCCTWIPGRRSDSDVFILGSVPIPERAAYVMPFS